MSAAVADFRPRHPAANKLKKDAGAPTIELERTEDVLSGLSARRRVGGTGTAQILIGFAAEHGEGALRDGRDKLEKKDLDAVVVNDISRPGIGFDAGENEVTILTADGGARDVPRAAKERVAAVVVQEDQRLRAGKEQANRTSRADPRSAARIGGVRRARPAAGRQHLERGPGQAADAQASAGGAARRGPRAGGGQPGRWQDSAGPGAGSLDRLPIRAGAVHVGSAARRRGAIGREACRAGV